MTMIMIISGITVLLGGTILFDSIKKNRQQALKPSSHHKEQESFTISVDYNSLFIFFGLLPSSRVSMYYENLQRTCDDLW